MTVTPLGDNHAAKLLNYIERIEELELEKAKVADQIKSVLAEAKAEQFDVKGLKRILKLRGADIDATAEGNSTIEVYLKTLAETECEFSDWAGEVIEQGVV